MLHTRLNQLKQRNPLNDPLVRSMVPGFKVNLLQKEVTMLKWKGYKSRLTCKQTRDTYTYGRLLRWGHGMYFSGRSHCVYQILGKVFYQFASNTKSEDTLTL